MTSLANSYAGSCPLTCLRVSLPQSRARGSGGGVMAGLVILLIVGFAGVAVLLACLRGFSRELWRKKVSGVVIRIEEPKVRRPQGPGTPSIGFPQRKTVPSKDPAPHRVS